MWLQQFSYNRIFAIGLGFLIISIAWEIYNAFMPLMLGEFTDSDMLIGMIMGIDNFANLLLIPIIAAWSDRVSSSFGKRIPFLMVGMPLAAIFLLLMPSYNSLLYLILVDIGFLLSMTIFRAPTVSLMPDVTPSDKRSPANGIINFMGGVGALIAFFVMGTLYDMDQRLPFYITAGVMIVILVILTFVMKRVTAQNANSEQNESSESFTNIVKGVKDVFVSKDRSTLYLLMAIFFWFIGYSGVSALFTRYGTQTLGLTGGQSTILLGFMSVSFLLFAIPSGFLGKKFGRTRIIQFGLVFMALTLFGLFFFDALIWIRVLLLVGGLSWAFINIHSYPMVVDLTTNAKIGLFTGIYYLFSSLSQMIGPTIIGLTMDLFGSEYMFLSSALFTLVALFFMSRVHRLHKNGATVQK